MDFDEEFSLEHLIFQNRQCRTCHLTKDLISEFYKTRRGTGPSAYSYECKKCTIKRITDSRKNKTPTVHWEYPDW